MRGAPAQGPFGQTRLGKVHDVRWPRRNVEVVSDHEPVLGTVLAVRVRARGKAAAARAERLSPEELRRPALRVCRNALAEVRSWAKYLLYVGFVHGRGPN